MKFGVVIAALSLLLLAACGKDDSASTKKEEGKTEGYSVKHAMGTATIKSAKRVVVLTNEGTEAVLALGVKPVGAVKSWLGNPWYDHIKKDMDGVTVVGDESQVSVEKVASLKPDLIIGNKVRQEKVYEQLNKIAPTVFAEDLRGNWKHNFSLYAQALHKEKEGENVLKEYDQRVAALKKEAGKKLDEKISVVRFLPGVSRIYSTNSFSGEILKQIGFKRPQIKAKDDFAAEVNKEQTPMMDGDRIFYFTFEMGDGKAAQQEKEWTNDPLWKKLKGVQKGHAYKVSDAIWNTAGGVKAAHLLLDDIEKFIIKK
ncbi:ABC transporter substrate-binding protein [Fictibacillus macauensis]|nr:iron-siderophore ABC transporter substrate-binding protein [Fictibacillus macauensis]